MFLSDSSVSAEGSARNYSRQPLCQQLQCSALSTVFCRIVSTTFTDSAYKVIGNEWSVYLLAALAAISTDPCYEEQDKCNFV